MSIVAGSASNRLAHLTAAAVVDVAFGVGVTALLTLGGRALDLNAATIGFLFLISVLGLAVGRGLAAALLASLTATLCFNYYFLPPLHTLTIAEPANWVSLVSFLTASVVGSQLITRARRQAARAELRQREVQMLYDLCFRLFTARPQPGGLQEVMPLVFGLLGARGGELRIEGPSGALLSVSAPVSALDGDAGTRRDVTVPILLGAAMRGTLELRQTDASQAVLESAGRLVALAAERERLIEEASHAEVLRQSDALKTALLRAMSHDLRSPLTAMGLELVALRRQIGGNEGSAPALAALESEQARLARRIDNLLTMARLEAGVARPHPEPTPAASLFRAAREALVAALAGRQVVARVPQDCPDLLVDPSLVLEILVNLLENAARAALPALPIELAALPGQGVVALEVRDRGPGLSGTTPRAADALREASMPQGGLGLAIARGLAEANHGRLEFEDRPGGGTVARVILPAAEESCR